MRILASLILLITLVGCGAAKKLKFEDVRNVRLDYDKSHEINNGSKLAMSVVAELSDGSEIDISQNKILTVTSDRGNYSSSNKQLAIGMQSPNFNSPEVRVNMTLDFKEEDMSFFEIVNLNYTGNLNLDFSGANGIDGVSAKDLGTRYLFADGKDGDHGNKWCRWR